MQIENKKYKEIKGDIIQLALKGNFDLVIHGLNCQNTQKSGISSQFVKAFGTNTFKMESNEYKGDINKLGMIDFKKIKTTKVVNGWKVKSSIELTIVNCYTQFMYGTNHTDGVSKPLDYEALTLCLRKINHIFKGKHIGLPGFIGGGLAGGNIDIIRSTIQEELKDMDVTVVFLEQNKHLMLNGK